MTGSITPSGAAAPLPQSGGGNANPSLLEDNWLWILRFVFHDPVLNNTEKGVLSLLWTHAQMEWKWDPSQEELARQVGLEVDSTRKVLKALKDKHKLIDWKTRHVSHQPNQYEFAFSNPFWSPLLGKVQFQPPIFNSTGQAVGWKPWENPDDGNDRIDVDRHAGFKLSASIAAYPEWNWTTKLLIAYLVSKSRNGYSIVPLRELGEVGGVSEKQAGKITMRLMEEEFIFADRKARNKTVNAYSFNRNHPLLKAPKLLKTTDHAFYTRVDGKNDKPLEANEISTGEGAGGSYVVHENSPSAKLLKTTDYAFHTRVAKTESEVGIGPKVTSNKEFERTEERTRENQTSGIRETSRARENRDSDGQPGLVSPFNEFQTPTPSVCMEASTVIDLREPIRTEYSEAEMGLGADRAAAEGQAGGAAGPAPPGQPESGGEFAQIDDLSPEEIRRRKALLLAAGRPWEMPAGLSLSGQAAWMTEQVAWAEKFGLRNAHPTLDRCVDYHPEREESTPRPAAPAESLSSEQQMVQIMRDYVSLNSNREPHDPARYAAIQRDITPETARRVLVKIGGRVNIQPFSEYLFEVCLKQNGQAYRATGGPDSGGWFVGVAGRWRDQQERRKRIRDGDDEDRPPDRSGRFGSLASILGDEGARQLDSATSPPERRRGDPPEERNHAGRGSLESAVGGNYFSQLMGKRFPSCGGG